MIFARCPQGIKRAFAKIKIAKSERTTLVGNGAKIKKKVRAVFLLMKLRGLTPKRLTKEFER